MHKSFVTMPPTPPLEITGTLTFGPANPRYEKAQPCRDCSLVKPMLFSSAARYLFISQPFLENKPHTAMAKQCSKPRSFPQLSPALPQGWGPWLQMIRALQNYRRKHFMQQLCQIHGEHVPSHAYFALIAVGKELLIENGDWVGVHAHGLNSKFSHPPHT